ncbi:DUF4870 domain-containing protein [Virgibacillus sp. W0430]|uniref:DUF4870 domain-containing protein n=1 Tax=Virgibacillus sp. W0430 TaxID=3391580 RepID=UPI003F47C955
MGNDQTESKEQTVFKEDTQDNSKPGVNQTKASSGLDENIAGLLCYLVGFVTGIIFLLIEKENRFVRFHALQSIITFAGIFILSFVLTALPVIGWIIGILLSPLSVILWIILMVKAYQGKMFKLPIAGNIAEKQLNQMKN